MDLLSPYTLVFFFTAIVGVGVLIRLRARDFLEKYSGAVGVVLAVIAGAYVLVKYDNSQQDKRMARTLAYIDRIESGSIHESRQWLDLHWVRNRELIANIREANNRKDGRDEALQLLEIYRRSFDETDEELQSNINHIMRLAYFYSGLSKCVELDLCDASTACNIFANEIGEFYVFHSDFIQRWSSVSFEQDFQTIKLFLNKTCDVG